MSTPTLGTEDRAPHTYEPTVVARDESTPTRFVTNKTVRVLNNGLIVRYLNETSGVMHFEVQSTNPDTPNFFYRVEYDRVHRTFRCQCKSGLYGKLKKDGTPITCTHVNAISELIDWGV